MPIPETLVVDDRTSFVEIFQEVASTHNISGAAFYHSLNDARRAAATHTFDRFVADQVFDDEDDDGVTFLEDMHRAAPNSEKVLLTGKRLRSGAKERIRSIGGCVVQKASLDPGLAAKLLRTGIDPGDVTRVERDYDIGEINLKFLSLKERFDKLLAINDEMIRDLVTELKSSSRKKGETLVIGGRVLSSSQLKIEVEQRTPVGLELIRLHHELYRTLREERSRGFFARLVPFK